jgi:hypothetical protein
MTYTFKIIETKERTPAGWKVACVEDVEEHRE